MASPDAVSQTLPVGGWQARLTLSGAGEVTLGYLDPAGQDKVRLPREVAASHRAALDAVKARTADIKRALAEARRRIEQTFRTGRDWAVADWAARYCDQPLTRVLAGRLIWTFTPDAGAPFDAIGTAGGLTGWDGTSRGLPGSGRVRLWHPTAASPADRAAWRAYCLGHGVRQPIFQAWRPVYDLTPPEQRTATYSNRFAGLVLDQPALVHILRGRGWTIGSRMLGCVPKGFAPARLALPGYGLVAEYWGSGAGGVCDTGGAPNFRHFVTSQVRFYAADQVGCAQRRATPLSEVPPQAFTEAMFDIDLVSGITTVARALDWSDPGPNAAPPPAERRNLSIPFDSDTTRQGVDQLGLARRDMLAWLVPKLAIRDRCHMHQHWLHVRGQWNEYAIHCGNGAVRVTASNRHVCIVPAALTTLDAMDGVPLPFVGDDLLSVILSKAMLLADETRIRDQDIVRQLT